MTTKYTGSCHCGRIAFEVEGDLTEAKECNCSHCSRKGYLLWFVPGERFHLKTPEDAVSTYRFNKHVISHNFCPSCGCAPFATGTGPGGAATAAVNVRCLENVDVGSIKRVPVDGRSR
ncbi:MAG TPA: GFA family protein [Casimicrobiaceae bacterium]|nr:GFA family protein [Casimicrobiaceae bacterium]